MTFLIYTVSFKTIQLIFFSNKRLLIFSGGNHATPYPPSYTAYLTPHPRFFHQNDRKGCSLDCLNGLGHFHFGFVRQGKISRGGNHSPWEDEGYAKVCKIFFQISIACPNMLFSLSNRYGTNANNATMHDQTMIVQSPYNSPRSTQVSWV